MPFTSIKDLRKATGLTQREFGEKYGIPVKTVQNWESDRHSGEGRRCPEYVASLLERVVQEDFPGKYEKNLVDKAKAAELICLSEKHEKTLRYAVDVIGLSPLAADCEAIILYGSTARREVEAGSDVDLLMVLSEKLRGKPGIEREIRRLKGAVSSPDYRLPEADLHIAYGQEWKSSEKAYYKNIRRDGIALWS